MVRVNKHELGLTYGALWENKTITFNLNGQDLTIRCNGLREDSRRQWIRNAQDFYKTLKSMDSGFPDAHMRIIYELFIKAFPLEGCE